MTRALVLNAGASWCAYQIGALRHLVGQRDWRFDLCAGTGIGAMNAAFVACGRMAALEQFWTGLRLWDLLPSRRRRFLAAHLSEAALAERDTLLLLTVLDLQTGRQQVLRYPGSALPLVDAVLAAGAMPGLVPPVRHGGHQLVEGTLLDGVPMGPVLERHPTEVVAILPGLPADGGVRRRYSTWFAVLKRALAVNQAEDGRRALTDAAAMAAEAEAYRRAAAGLSIVPVPQGDGSVADRLRAAFEGHQPPDGPRLVTIRPSRPLAYPMWRFRRSELHDAMALGERDARAVP